MKYFLVGFFFVCFFFPPSFANAVAYDPALATRLSGRILLQVQQHGEAWYVRTSDSQRYYMKDGATAYQIMRLFSLGITDGDLSSIPSVADTTEMNGSSSVCATNAFADRLKGQILLQVQQHGEAWYVDPVKCRAIYMADGDAAYQIMRYLGLGILDDDLEKIQAGESPVDSGAVAGPLDTTPSETGSTYLVSNVVDGDTIDVLMGTETKRVRLLGVDTPETVDPGKPVQCYGPEASAFVEAQLSNASVTLQDDPSQGDTDIYGRLLRYVFLTDGTDFDQVLIKEGYGREYTYDKPYLYQTAYKAAQTDAETNKRGLWADDTCAGTTTSVTPPASTTTPTENTTPSVGFSCGSKTTCGEMGSCDEAKYYLNTCGLARLDSDHDGIPCESICD